MKRQKHKIKQPHKQKADRAIDTGKPHDEPARRDVLRVIRNGALVVAGIGGSAWYVVKEVKANIREQDLSQIGNGIPSVVQIHDPQCTLCVALQRETRDALANFEEGELQFLVANIRQSEGRQLATKHGVGNVTLLLFDAAGERRDILVGSNTSDFLEQEFRRHFASDRSS